MATIDLIVLGMLKKGVFECLRYPEISGVPQYIQVGEDQHAFHL